MNTTSPNKPKFQGERKALIITAAILAASLLIALFVFPSWKSGQAQQNQIAAFHSPNSSSADPAVDPQEQTVYITRTGEKYHRDGCQYLRQSRIPITKKKAIEQGYTPCSRCAP